MGCLLAKPSPLFVLNNTSSCPCASKDLCWMFCCNRKETDNDLYRGNYIDNHQGPTIIIISVSKKHLCVSSHEVGEVIRSPLGEATSRHSIVAVS